MSFWDHEHKHHVKELKYSWKSQKYAYREEKRRNRGWRRMNRHCHCFNSKGRPMCCGLLFGVLLILWGISQITGTLFNLHIPVFGIIFGLFLLYLGIQLITGFSYWPKSCCSQCTVESQECQGSCMGTSYVSIDDTILNKQKSPLNYKTTMGKNFIDLTRLTPEAIRATGTQLTVNIDTFFGKTILKLNKNIPVRVIVKGGCAKITTPDKCTTVCGSHTFNNHGTEQPLMVIYSSTFFGKTTIEVE